MKSLIPLLLIIVMGHLTKGQNKEVSAFLELEKYVGYYSVGVKPAKPFFNAKTFIRNNSLFIIFDGDIARELLQGENHQFYSKEDSLFQSHPIKFKVSNGVIKGFTLERPRSEWSTDLYGIKNEALNKYAVDTEVALVNHLSSLHFEIHYSQEKTRDIEKIRNTLETRYIDLLQAFAIDSIPKVIIRIYPDVQTYHNAVLTPEAPDWQAGRSWTKEEIRMVSPLAVKQDIAIEDLVLHEFIHCLNLQITDKLARTPGWLWEGVAMYKGCCKQFAISDLANLKRKKIPTLREIERDPTYQLKYQWGYYLIEFTVKNYGWEKVLSLIHTNGNIKASLNMSVKEFEKGFYAFMEKGFE